MSLFNWNKPLNLPAEPEPTRKPTVFIPGSFASWCNSCWGVLSTIGTQDKTCSRCGKELQFIATSLTMTPHPRPERKVTAINGGIPKPLPKRTVTVPELPPDKAA